MMQILTWQRAATAALASMGMAVSGQAMAHVKWFCAFDVAGQPRGLERVLCTDFEVLCGLSVAALALGCAVEGTALGEAMIRALDRVTAWVRANTELLVRAVAGAFFVSIWAMGGILLTPELKPPHEAISWMQLAMAACLLWRRTMPLTGLGIVVLFGIAVHQYGVFHLADYPVFLGVAAYLVLTGLGRDLYGVRPLDVVRYAAAITLMWASIEKWAYPEWSFGMLVSHPSITLGYDFEFVMRAAGVVEFALAFGLLWTPLVRRMSAAILAGVFVAAIFEFGKVDAVGHSLIIVALIGFVADNAAAPVRARQVALLPVAYAASLVLFLAAYYLGHLALYGASYT